MTLRDGRRLNVRDDGHLNALLETKAAGRVSVFDQDARHWVWLSLADVVGHTLRSLDEPLRHPRLT
jgi:hypothetical protein